MAAGTSTNRECTANAVACERTREILPHFLAATHVPAARGPLHPAATSSSSTRPVSKAIGCGGGVLAGGGWRTRTALGRYVPPTTNFWRSTRCSALGRDEMLAGSRMADMTSAALAAGR